jgi:predicted  nucleic acid-binding Zn-ribbon protein
MQSNLYELDFYAWTVEQSKLLKEGDLKNLDIVNLVEEVESLGKQQRQELRNRLGVLIGHLLKWNYQPEKRSKSWRVTIREQRREILIHLKENPSLQPYLEEAIVHAYESALDLAVRETPLDYQDLPANCPYTLDQLFDSDFPQDLNVI